MKTTVALILSLFLSPMAQGRGLAAEFAPIVTAASTVGSIEPALLTTSAAEPAAEGPNETGEQVGPRFVCRGTQTFWMLRIEQTKMMFELNSRSSGAEISQYSRPVATSSANSEVDVTNFSGQAADGSSIDALIVDARLNGGVACSDGMSNQEYAYTAFVKRSDGSIYNGCCWMER